MKKLTLLLPILLLGTIGFSQVLTPRQLYGPLFEAIQMSHVLPDNKTFVDCTPIGDPATIRQEYLIKKDQPGFDLKSFFDEHFNLPPVTGVHYTSNIAEGVRKHILDLWEVLKREPDTQVPYSSLLPLPYPYVVPGGRFREMYYWDSYFTMLGLQESGKDDLLEDMVRNFAYLINTYGFVPNGTRTYYLTRSQPPFFSLMVDLLARIKGNYIYAIYQPALLKEYQFWMQGAHHLKPGGRFRNVVRMPDGDVLNRYWDQSDAPREESYQADVLEGEKTKEPLGVFYRNIRAAAESGWDFSSRWFRNGHDLSTIMTTGIVPVDLNCLIAHLEQTIGISYDVEGDKPQAQIYYDKAAKRDLDIQKYFWNKAAGFYTDYHFRAKRSSQKLTLAGLYPLFFKIANASQASRVAKVVEEKFLKSGGVVTTLSNTGQQWDSPNGWAPLEWITIKGLRNYDKMELASSIALNWIDLNEKVFQHTGKLMEKYNVVDTHLAGGAGGGEYPLQDGFGWTNGVLIKLMDMYSVK
ncbi:MAG: alpha,alpha-trehalase TreF [Chitinophagaceae bacterium]